MLSSFVHSDSFSSVSVDEVTLFPTVDHFGIGFRQAPIFLGLILLVFNRVTGMGRQSEILDVLRCITKSA